MDKFHAQKNTRVSSTAYSGGASISSIMSDLLFVCRREQHSKPTEITASYLEAAKPGMRSKTAVAGVSVLIKGGFCDEEIVACLDSVYRSIMAAKGAPFKPLARLVSDTRRGMSKRAGAPIHAVSELDALLNTTSWSAFQ